MACVTVPAATAEMERAFSALPGFRFHPTDQEIVNFFLRRKVQGHGGYFIPEVDLYKFEPHQLPGKSFSPSTSDPGAKVEWYLFAPRGRKYPTGLRMLRATLKGFWKSTGKDRAIMHNGIVIGMKKTLVFHIGRAPSGMRTDWVLHEYRLHGYDNHHIQIESEVDGVDTDKGEKQFLTDGDDTGNGEMQILTNGANKDEEGMQRVTGGASVDEDNSENSWYTRYLAEEDNSWMQFPFDDAWCTSDDVGMLP